MFYKFLLLLVLILYLCNDSFEKSLTFPVKNQVKRSLDNLNTVQKLDKFHCGTDGWVSMFAESKITYSCPSRYDEANMCCYQHDNCYSEQRGQLLCDEIFCDCLKYNVGGNGTDSKCVGTALYFCETVKDFGSYAYSASVTANSSNIGVTTKNNIQNPTSDLETISPNDDLETTMIPTVIPMIIDHFNKCIDEKEYMLRYCINNFDGCKQNDRRGEQYCDMEFCSCVSNSFAMKELQYVHSTCKQKLTDFCPDLLISPSFDLDTDTVKFKNTLWNLFIAYSNFIYLGLVIMFIFIYLYVKGYLHTYPLKYEQAPSELSQEGILSDLTMNMTDVTLLTPTRLKPPSNVNLEFSNKL